jgi:hypothetical protein
VGRGSTAVAIPPGAGRRPVRARARGQFQQVGNRAGRHLQVRVVQAALRQAASTRSARASCRTTLPRR